MGFDINKIGVISVRPMAISNELQVHGFIWLCIGRYFTFRICLDASLRRFGFEIADHWLFLSVRLVMHQFYEFVFCRMAVFTSRSKGGMKT